MRADAVSLEVPVKVHGSRVDSSPSGATPKSEAFEEQTSTMIVFPQGGVLKMVTPVTAGQMMVVTNLKSGHDSICRVVKVRAYGQGQSYVEIEFTHRQPGYWGVYFPSDGPDPANQAPPVQLQPAAPAIPPVSVELKVEKTGERSTADASAPVPASTAKLPVTKPTGPPSKEDSVFAPIGSQEQVQPAASATSSRVKSISDVGSKQLDFGSAGKSPRMDSLSVESSSPAASVSIGELQGDVEGVPAVSFAGAGVPGEVAEAPLIESGRSTPFGQLASTATLSGGHGTVREPFGSTLGSSSLAISGRAAESGQSRANRGTAITVTAVALVVAAAGAAYYFRLLPFGSKPAVKPPAAISVPNESSIEANPAPANLGPQPLNATSNPQPNFLAAAGSTTAPSMASTPSVRGNAIVAPAPRSAKPSAAAQSEPEPTPAQAPSAPNPSPKVPDMFGALNAHPTARAYSGDSGQADAAPAVDAPAAETGENGLSAIDASSAIAPPATEPEAPVRIRVGGELKPPRLVSSVLPVYPTVARDTGIEGDVVIDTTIDKTGRVTGMKVVSGPAVLRGPALDALRQWKYEPSKLNGEPVPVEMTVTIRFHRQ